MARIENTGLARARYLVLALALLVITGCAGPETRYLLASADIRIADDAVAGRERIFIATTRHRSAIAAEVFDGRRAMEMSFARVDVSVPKGHVAGKVERPGRGAHDPAEHFHASNLVGFDSRETFRDDLAASIRAEGGRAMVFIHGYNTRFDDAVYRLTQVAHDAGYRGAPVLFTWASGGRTIDYIYDRDSSTAARDGLEHTLRLVAAAGATRIDIIAHSMGNWVTLEALRQLAITGDRDLGGKMGDVVLASPDVDVDVFKTQMQRYGRPDKPFLLMLSRNDRALNISGLIAGNRPRLGEYADAEEIAELGVIVVNVTDVEAGDRFNHTKFADNPVLIGLLGQALDTQATLPTVEGDLAQHIETLARSIGQTAFSAASIVITTPAAVVGSALPR